MRFFLPLEIDSDEAIVGLMARHILKGEFPIFYYGQYYMGTLEACLAALLFAFFGSTVFVLKIAPLVPFAGFLIVHYFFVGHLAGPRVAALGTSLLAVSPAFLSIWSLEARGGYTILLLLGTAALWTGVKIGEEGLSLRRAGLLGFVLGLAWWTHFLSVVYAVPIGLVLLWKDEKAWLSRAGGLFAAGFMAGSLPFWIFNVQHPLASLGIGGARQTSWLSDFANIFGTGIPIILGARPNWGGSASDYFPLSGLLVTSAFLICVIRMIRGPKTLLIPITFTILFPFLLSTTGFAWFMQEPRYLIPLYSTLYLVLLSSARNRWAQFSLFAALITLNLVGTLRITESAESLAPLIQTLRKHNVRGGYADYWLAYRLTFESGEQIIATSPGGPVMRYQPYLDFVKTLPAPAYITPGADIQPPENYDAIPAGSYTIHLPPPLE